MKTLLRFHAPWCMPCKASAPSWESFKSHNPQMSFKDINVDEDDTLAVQYGVMSVPAVVLLEDDRAIKTRVGSFSEKDLISLVV